MLDRLVRLLVVAAHLLAVDGIWCDAGTAVEQRYRESRVPSAVGDPVLGSAVAADEVITVSGTGAQRRVVRSAPRSGPEVLLEVEARIVPGGEYLFAGEGNWWYGIAAVHDHVQSTIFVSDAGRAVVPINGVMLVRWLPLRSETPRALELTISRDGAPMATEIDAGGALRSWHLPMPLSPATSAEILPDGRIAMVTQQRESKRLFLLLLGNDDHVDTVSLGYKMLLQLATAVDRSGHLAVATTTTDQRVDGAVIDPAHAGEPVWRELRREVRLSGSAGELQAAALSEGFAVSWINRSASPPRLEAGNLYDGHGGGGVRTIGTVTDRAYFALRTENGEPVWTWDDGRDVLRRRLPASLDGFDWIAGMAEWLGCSAASGLLALASPV